MRRLLALLSFVPLAACGQTVYTDSVNIEAGANVRIEQGRRDPCYDDYGRYVCTGGDGYQYIPPYHPYSQVYRPRFSRGRQGLDPNRLYYRDQPGTVTRRSSGPEGLDPNTLYLNQGERTPDTRPYEPQGLDPDTLTLRQRERRDRDRGPEGLDRRDLYLDQPRVRPEPRQRSSLDRCPYLEGTDLWRSDRRCR